MATTPTDNPNADAAIAPDADPVDVDPVDGDGPREWFLSAAELAATRAKITKLNQRATRKGFTGTIDVAAEPATRAYTPGPGALPVTVHGYTVTITGQPPSYQGWRFVAAVDTVATPQPAPITRSTDLDRPGYFHLVQPTIIGADGTGWPATSPVQPSLLHPGERQVWSVLQVDPNGDTHLVCDHGTPAEARQRADDLDAALAAGGQPQFKLPDIPAEAVLRYPPGADQVIANDLLRPGECDHCNTTRERTSTFLVENEDTGALRQVGRSCLKDFLGHSTLPVFIDTDQVGDEITRAVGGRAAAADWDLSSVLAYAWAAVETHGFTPTRSGGDRIATRDLVDEVLGQGRRSKQLLDGISGKLAEGQQMAPRMISDLLERLDDTSGYQANLAVILRAGVVNRAKHLGLAVSAVTAWQRLTTPTPPAPEPAPKPDIRHAGTVGERITLTGTISTAFHVDGYTYNSPPQRLLILDCGETVAKMVTAASWACDVKQGEQVTIAAVVKAHTDYHGTPQTVLTRPKRLPDPTPDTPTPATAAAVELPGPVRPVWETVLPVSPSRFQEAALAAAATTPAPTAPLGVSV